MTNFFDYVFLIIGRTNLFGEKSLGSAVKKHPNINICRHNFCYGSPWEFHGSPWEFHGKFLIQIIYI